MIKQENAKTIINVHYCDDCGKKLHHELQCTKAVCEYCKKELCEDCIGYEIGTHGDYRTVFCKQCWEVAKEYHLKIDQLEQQIDKLYEECEKKCREL